jgi:hypothetical protein
VRAAPRGWVAEYQIVLRPEIGALVEQLVHEADSAVMCYNVQRGPAIPLDGAKGRGAG